MRNVLTLLLALAAWFFCGPAFASIEFVSAPDYHGGISVNNNYKLELADLGFNAQLSGALKTTAAGRIDFYFHGQESWWVNSFTAFNQDDSVAFSYTETPEAKFTPWSDAGTFIGSLEVAAGDILKLLFSSDMGKPHEIGVGEFGVFAAGTGTGANFVLTNLFANDGRVYFGHDDNGANKDDNHDDIMISAVFVPAPEPLSVAVWCGLACVVGAGYGMRKRS